MRTALTTFTAVLLTVLLVGCATSDSDGPSDLSDVGEAEGAANDVAAEVFVADDGAGCALYVSVSEADALAAADQRALLWSGLVGENVKSCSFSDVVEVGLVTVEDLDSYNQPDWTTVIEHGYFSVENWTDLVDQCFTAELSSECRDLLAVSLTQ